MSVPLRLLSLVLAASLAGCATVRPQSAFSDVEQTLDGRTEASTVWRTGSEEDARADRAVDSLLAAPLTADAAVQVALLNNRRLQAVYEDVGVAQADLVQAGLLANPIVGAGALFPLEGSESPELRFSVAQSFLSIFSLPLRRGVARSAYEAARLRVAQAVLRYEADTRAAFYRAQADAARLTLQQAVVENTQAAYQASRLLREAGNVPAVDLLAEQALFEQARLDLVSAEAQTTESRERLARLMGVFGERAAFALAGQIPPAPDTAETLIARASSAPNSAAALEAQAVTASLALAAARQDIETVGRRLGLTNLTALVPDFEIGVEVERREGEYELGPEVELALPLFDQGQGRLGRVRAELRRAQARYYATGVEVRSTARVLARRLDAARATAVQYQSVVLPLRAELTQQTLLQYNAMQTGVFGLLNAQQMEIVANRRYLDRLADYWRTRTDVALLLAGGMPDVGAGALAMPEGDGMDGMMDADH